jgi:hypothetical protein
VHKERSPWVHGGDSAARDALSSSGRARHPNRAHASGVGLATDDAKPVRVGDYVQTPDGRHGYVWTALPAPDRHRPSTHDPLVLVRIEEDDPLAETVEEWFEASACTPIRHVHGSQVRCEAVENGWRCTRWAARTVTTIPQDERSRVRCDDSSDGSPSMPTEQRASCWQHLAVAVFWAEQRSGHGRSTVSITLPVGGSHERPLDVEHVSFHQAGANPTPIQNRYRG